MGIIGSGLGRDLLLEHAASWSIVFMKTLSGRAFSAIRKSSHGNFTLSTALLLLSASALSS